MLSCVTTSRVAVIAIVTALLNGCMKDLNPQITLLVSNIETVDQWSRGPQWKEHADWLRRAIAWDIVGVVTMTLPDHEVDPEEEVERQKGMDDMLRSGLAEVAAGPGDHIVSLVNGWRRTLGTGRCRISPASDADVRWARERLALAAPRGAGPESRQALAGYAKRASDTHDFVRIECGGSAHMIVGVLGERLVPIVRE